MFRRGNGSLSQGDGGLVLTRPLMHFTALCWMGVTGLLAFATS